MLLTNFVQDAEIFIDANIFTYFALQNPTYQAACTAFLARVEAVRVAWLSDGVREVINEIELSDQDSFAGFARDRWIETRLRAKLLGDKDVNSLNISIESVNQSVYLIGVTHSQDEMSRVVGHARTVPYVRRVVSYLAVKPREARGS